MFLKTENFKNHFCPVLATQSRVSQVAGLSREFAGLFWRLIRKWKVQSRGLLRDFRGSARDSLAGRPSSCEKHLESFFQNFVFTKIENFKNSVALFWQLSRGSYKSHGIVASSRVDFGDLFASGRSSCEGYTEIFTAQLATP